MTEHATDNALLAAWQKTLARKGGLPAILSTRGGALRSFEEVEGEAAQLGNVFEGLPPRSIAGVQVGNSERWPAILLALWRRKVIPMPLGCQMQPTEAELALSTCGAAGIIKLEAGKVALHRASAAGSGRVRSEPATEFLKLTSGTTSLPRAVCFTAGQLVADCENICATMGIGPDDTNFGVIPFSHSYGFSHLITPLLVFGIPLVVSDDRMPRAILEGLARTGATVFPATPLFFQKLGHMEKAPQLPKLRLCISAGAPLLRAAAAPFTAKFGLKIHTFYGASECGGIAYDATEAPIYEDGFLGTVMSGVSISHDAPEAGAITVSGAAVGEGYFPETDAALADGRFVPADLIGRAERGLFLAGRVSDVINVAGRKLNPLEIEALLTQFSGVKQAIVFGVRSELRGEEPVACIAGNGIDREGLLRYCRERLSPWQIPRDLWMVDEIPANERGKVSRRELAECYGARTASRKL